MKTSHTRDIPLETSERQPKKRGPVPRLGPMVQGHIYLPEDLLTWAKQQPERLSGLVRRLLTQERNHQEQQ